MVGLVPPYSILFRHVDTQTLQIGSGILAQRSHQWQVVNFCAGTVNKMNEKKVENAKLNRHSEKL